MNYPAPKRPAAWPAFLERLWVFLNRDVWSVELGGLPTFRRIIYKLSRIVYLAGRGFDAHNGMSRSSALAFITVLSVVPLLAVAFSVAKGLGAYDRLRSRVIDPFLRSAFDVNAEGEAGSGNELFDAIQQVLEFVQNTNMNNLGAFGLLVLVYTVLKLLGSIELAFNEIWSVRRARTWVRRFTDYLSMVVIVPVLLVAATAATTGSQTVIEDKLHLGPIVEEVLRYGVWVVVWVGFAVAYLLLPNTRVRVTSAILGGVVGGTLWQAVQLLHVVFQFNVARYNALYSGLAAIPVFLFWVYLSWVTVLVGAEFAYAHQSECAYRQITRALAFDRRLKERVAMRAMARIAVTFLDGRQPLRPLALAERMAVPEHTLIEVLEKLAQAGLLVFVEDEFEEDAAVVPARSLDHIFIQDVLDGLAGQTVGGDLAATDPMDGKVDDALVAFKQERRGMPGNLSLKVIAQRMLALETLPSSNS